MAKKTILKSEVKELAERLQSLLDNIQGDVSEVCDIIGELSDISDEEEI